MGVFQRAKIENKTIRQMPVGKVRFRFEAPLLNLGQSSPVQKFVYLQLLALVVVQPGLTLTPCILTIVGVLCGGV